MSLSVDNSISALNALSTRQAYEANLKALKINTGYGRYSSGSDRLKKTLPQVPFCHIHNKVDSTETSSFLRMPGVTLTALLFLCSNDPFQNSGSPSMYLNIPLNIFCCIYETITYSLTHFSSSGR